MKAQKKRAPGRPAVSEAERKSVNLTFRTRGELREMLTEAAKVSGRSVSEEIEWRLGQSFFMEEVVDRATKTAIEATLAWVDREREKERAERFKPSIPLTRLGKPEDEE